MTRLDNSSRLEAYGLSFGYASASAMDLVFAEVQLALRPGEIVSVLGQSGVGKSSVLRVLAGLLKPHQGSVLLQGAAIARPSPIVALAFQEARLLPWLTLEENVAFGLSFRCQPKLPRSELATRVTRAIERVGLAHARKLRPAQLSGGMAQRAAFARYLARKPQVMLLDEPFAALDALTRADLQELLLELAREERTSIVLSTHDVDEALRLSDRVLLLAGRPATIVQAWDVSRRSPESESTSQASSLKPAILAALTASMQSAASTCSSATKESPYVQLV